MIHKRSTALEQSVKIFFTGGLKLVSRRQPHPYFKCGSRHLDVLFAWKIPNISFKYLQEHINQDMKRRESKDKDSTVHKTYYRNKINPVVKPLWASIDKSLSPNRHRVWSPTHRRAIKEESKVAKSDWVDHRACRLLQYIEVIYSHSFYNEKLF